MSEYYMILKYYSLGDAHRKYRRNIQPLMSRSFDVFDVVFGADAVGSYS